VIGQPVNIVKLYQLQGVNPTTLVYDFTDFNGDGKIASPDDRQVIRNLGQQFYGGLSNELRYRNWNFSFLLQFVKQQSRNYNSAMSSPGIMANLPVGNECMVAFKSQWPLYAVPLYVKFFAQPFSK
jgi:isochorismate hydrolase